MFYILSCGRGNIGYNIPIRDYPLFDVDVYATSTIILDIKPRTYNLIRLLIVTSLLTINIRNAFHK